MTHGAAGQVPGPSFQEPGILGATIEKYSARASTDSQMALISLGADCAVGVVGKTCIGVPTRLIYSLKSWIDKSFIKRFK
jgi:NADH:ubiquinone reductase (H+-translocating)